MNIGLIFWKFELFLVILFHSCFKLDILFSFMKKHLKKNRSLESFWLTVLKLWHYCAASVVGRGGKFKLSTARRQIRVRCFDFLERVVLFIWISSAASRGAILTSKLELFLFWGPGKLWKETYITEFYGKFWRKNL